MFLLRLDARAIRRGGVRRRRPRRRAALARRASPGTWAGLALALLAASTRRRERGPDLGCPTGRAPGPAASSTAASASRPSCFAWLRYRRIRFPARVATRARCSTAIGTAFYRRGPLPRRRSWGCCSRWAWRRPVADRRPAAASTPLRPAWARRPDRELLVSRSSSALVGGWLLLVHAAGIAAAIVGHAITRFAIFLATGHTDQPRARGREVEDDRRSRRRHARWLAASSARPASRDDADGEPPDAQPCPRPTARPAPPVGLYVHIPFCVSLCPYCDFVVVAGCRGARTAQPDRRRSRRPLHVELELRADALDAPFGRRPGAPRSTSCTSVAGRRRCCTPTRSAGSLEHVGRRFGLAPDAEVTLEANPGPDERGDLAGFRAAGVTRLSIGAQRLDDRRAAPPGSTAPAPRRGRRRAGRADGGHRVGQPRPALRHARPDARDVGARRSTARSSWRPTTSRSMR